MNKAVDYSRLSLIQKYLDKIVADKEVAGCSCLVIKDGQELGYYEAGLRDVKDKLPITRDTIFRLFSMTKPITSIATMQLVENGQLSLTDPVSKFLPGFKNQKYYDENGELCEVIEEMTVKNLLDMTSGLCYPGLACKAEVETGMFMAKAAKKLHTDEEMSTYDLMNELGKLPLAFAPSDKWNYSLSADVLGAIVEIVSGVSFSEYLHKNILDPLEMFDTDFYVPTEKQDRLCRSYRTDGINFKEYTGENLLIQSRMEEEPKFQSGGAGLASTIDDYSKICQMFLNNGEYKGKRILHPETIRYMTSGGANERQRQHIGKWDSLAGHTYGNLLRVLKHPEEAMSLGSAGEFGWDGWLGVYMSVIPEHNMCILYMMQKPDTGTVDVTFKLRNIIFSALS